MGLSGLNLRVLVPYVPALGWGASRTRDHVFSVINLGFLLAVTVLSYPLRI